MELIIRNEMTSSDKCCGKKPQSVIEIDIVRKGGNSSCRLNFNI